MTSTMRLDALAADGTDGGLVPVRLADATVLAVSIRPGATYADCVRLISPLEAPDTEAWENEDHVEAWLTDALGDFSDYIDVPLPDLRDLMDAHGGEHEDQAIPEPPTTAGEVLLNALADLDIPVHTDGMSPSYAIPQDPATPEREVFNRPRLLVADRAPSVEHPAASHTGWVVWEHDANGHPVGDALYTGDESIDCQVDSEAAAETIACWLAENRA
ncbi:hypothetical protein [Streptomyces sp. NPDC020983]|uniref:hypothetical protein n=1 Tax=Streptomyces sp. NPDC020983 TaxID=3365106 RepID=UPI0037A28D23